MSLAPSTDLKKKVVDAMLERELSELHTVMDVELQMKRSAEEEEEFGAERLTSKREEIMDEAALHKLVENTKEDRIFALRNVPVHETLDKIAPGALVITANGNYLISTAIKPLKLDGHEFIGISIEAPIYRVMDGKGPGDEFVLAGRNVRIEGVC